MIGADEADELDPSALGPLVGQFRQRDRRPLGGLAACFVGGLPAGGAVAMLAVGEALERVGARAQMLDASETLLAEEALVERVVEVLDAAVAPRLTRRDEHGRDALAQAHAHDLAAPSRPLRRGHERAAVVELHALWNAVATPQRMQRAKHTLIAAILDDLDPGVVRGDVDLVERVKAHPAVEVARSDQVDLYHVAGHARGGRGVRDPLRSAPTGALPPRRASALQDRLDRALGRHGRAELLTE